MDETDVPTATLYFLWSDDGFFDDIYGERVAQIKKWGVQHWPGGTNTSPGDQQMADEAKRAVDAAMVNGDVTWRDILVEEILEAFAEKDWLKIRTELVQSAAVIAAWIEDRDEAYREAESRPLTHPWPSTPVPDADQSAEG